MDNAEVIENQTVGGIEVALDQAFYPFDHLNPAAILDKNQSPIYAIPQIGKAVFRYSNEIPSATGKNINLHNNVYVWVEVALDTSLTPDEIKNMSHSLDVVILPEGSESEILGIPRINEQGDRFKFISWGETKDSSGTPTDPLASLPMILPKRLLGSIGAKFKMQTNAEVQGKHIM